MNAQYPVGDFVWICKDCFIIEGFFVTLNGYLYAYECECWPQERAIQSSIALPILFSLNWIKFVQTNSKSHNTI